MADCTGAPDREQPLRDNLLLYVPASLKGNRLTLREENGPTLLQRTVEDWSPDILIIDNWRLFLDGDENDNQAVRHGLKILSSLRGIAPNLAVPGFPHPDCKSFSSPRGGSVVPLRFRR